MPIKKFNSFEEASKALWVFNPDEKYYEKLKELFYFWSKLSEKKYLKGIQKFQSFEEFIKYKDNIYSRNSN